MHGIVTHSIENFFKLKNEDCQRLNKVLLQGKTAGLKLMLMIVMWRDKFDQFVAQMAQVRRKILLNPSLLDLMAKNTIKAKDKKQQDKRNQN